MTESDDLYLDTALDVIVRLLPRHLSGRFRIKPKLWDASWDLFLDDESGWTDDERAVLRLVKEKVARLRDAKGWGS